MPNFIECILQRSPNTDEEALKLYRIADNRARENAMQSNNKTYAADEVGDILYELMKAKLLHVDFKDEAALKVAQDNNINWIPSDAITEPEDQCNLALVQQVLDGTLSEHKNILATKWSEKCDALRKALDNYSDHLNPGAEMQEMGGKTSKKETTRLSSSHFMKEKNQKKIQKQNKAIAEMREALGGAKPACEKLKDFHASYAKHQKLIEASGDSASKTFSKIVNTILAYLRGAKHYARSIWATEGKKMSQGVREMFPADKKPQR